MTKLKKYELEAAKTLGFIKWNLNDLNMLSKSVLKYSPFNEGRFFTFLRNDISNDQLYSFKCGGVGGGVKNKIIDIVHAELISPFGGLCIFDDYDQDFDSVGGWNLYDQVGIHFQNEVYFAVESNNSNKDLLLNCFRASDCIWHSLIILCKFTFSRNKDQSITEKELKEIALTANYILLRAYDAEGYIIWQRNID